MDFCLSYHFPHKFRHGHAVNAIKSARDVSDLKAISQNLMHANLSITDGVYGVLSDADVRNRIQGLGSSESMTTVMGIDEMRRLLTEALRRLG
jgi:hypothetical protein